MINSKTLDNMQVFIYKDEVLSDRSHLLTCCTYLTINDFIEFSKSRGINRRYIYLSSTFKEQLIRAIKLLKSDNTNCYNSLSNIMSKLSLYPIKTVQVLYREIDNFNGKETRHCFKNEANNLTAKDFILIETLDIELYNALCELETMELINYDNIDSVISTVIAYIASKSVKESDAELPVL